MRTVELEAFIRGYIECMIWTEEETLAACVRRG